MAWGKIRIFPSQQALTAGPPQDKCEQSPSEQCLVSVVLKWRSAWGQGFFEHWWFHSKRTMQNSNNPVFEFTEICVTHLLAHKNVNLVL